MAERAHPEDPGFQGTIYEERLYERYRFCIPFIEGKDVLDAPCGTGWGTSLLEGAASLTGVDIDAEAIAFAEARFPGPRYLQAPLEELPLADAGFDVLVCLEGLEHLFLSDARRFLAEARRVLRSDGLLIVTAPLLRAGRHSGNPFHHYEFEPDELRALLAAGFEPIQVEVIDGGDGAELRFVGRRRGTPLAAPGPTPRPAAFERAGAWVLGLAAGAGFGFAAGHPTTLLGTCFALLNLDSLGALGGLPDERRSAWAAWLRGLQRAEDGLFADPLLEAVPPGDDGHDGEYLLYQMSYFALLALDALGAAPAHPLAFLERFEAPGAVAEWLSSLDWSNAWLQSNRVMFVLSGLIWRAEREGRAEARPAVHAILDWLDMAQDPATGLWGTSAGATLLNGMAAAYHFLPFYDYLRRPISRAEVIIDATLALQQPDGLFGAGVGGGACEDLDAIDVLVVCARLTPYRRADIRRALVRAFWAIWSSQNPDGGFGYAIRDDEQTYRYSGWAAMEQAQRESDSWATWFRLLALATIQRLFPEDLPALPEFNFRRRPALGYHRFDERIDPAEVGDVAAWIRPLPEAPAVLDPPHVSVIIPCFNLGLYLHEALASALRQTLQPVEVIVVDDGSTDPFTHLLLERLAHPQVRLLRQENRGLPAARNAGIGAARAELLCCLDADDRYRSNFLERAVGAIEADPSIGFVSSHYQEFDGRDGLVQPDGCDLPAMLVTNGAMVSSLFRRTAWQYVGGYCEDLEGMQDWDLWIGLLGAGYRGVQIPEVLFEYRIRPGSMYTRTSRPERYSELYRQIVARHPQLYSRWLPEILGLQARSFAEVVAYADGQSRLVRQYQLSKQAGHGSDTQDYHAQQAANWQAVAEQYEAARDYHAQQAANWQAVAEQYEAARDYHAQQAANWQAAAEQHLALSRKYMLYLKDYRRLLMRIEKFLPRALARRLGLLPISSADLGAISFTSPSDPQRHRKDMA